jgi:hypothetical protein
MRHVIRWLLVAVLFCGVCGLTVAQSKSDTTAQKPEKLYTVKFENTSWKDVIDWLEKESGLMCITKEKPTGSITLKSDKKYTLCELIDLFNERLEQYNLVLLRKSQSFSFYAADQKGTDRPHTERIARRADDSGQNGIRTSHHSDERHQSR